MRRLRNAEELLAPAVGQSLDALNLPPEFQGLARLARRYAAQIDEAARIAADLAELPTDTSVSRRIAALAKRVDAQAVLALLGPKLAETLEALGASPRAVKPKGVSSDGPVRSPLQAFRDARSA